MLKELAHVLPFEPLGSIWSLGGGDHLKLDGPPASATA